MGLLVEYSLKEGQAEAQEAALKTFVAGLKAEGVDGFSYSSFATDDPTKFIGLFLFDDEAGKQRFLNSAAFAAYRDGAGPRFTGPPSTTAIRPPSLAALRISTDWEKAHDASMMPSSSVTRSTMMMANSTNAAPVSSWCAMPLDVLTLMGPSLPPTAQLTPRATAEALPLRVWARRPSGNGHSDGLLGN